MEVSDLNRLLRILLGDVPFRDNRRVYNYIFQRESLASLITLTLSNLTGLVFSLSSSMTLEARLILSALTFSSITALRYFAQCKSSLVISSFSSLGIRTETTSMVDILSGLAGAYG
jgi:hypothetical protein